MKDIVLLIPYFGKLPEFLKVWMTSVKYNPTVDFCIFTNDRWEQKTPENVTIISMQWDEMCRRVKDVCGVDIVLNEPYKLCDYRPAYGEIFSEYVNGYDFWGHCDFDLVFGNIRSFLTEEILEQYDRVLTRGHFCIYRNTEENNVIYKNTAKYQGIHYTDAFHTKYSCHFDEGSTIKKAFEEGGKQTYDEVCFADIAYQQYPFRLAQNMPEQEFPQIYRWQDGVLKSCYLEKGRIKEKEYMYVHLQKRKMNITADELEDGFVIIPNEICKKREITAEYIEKNSRNSVSYKLTYCKMRIAGIWKNIKNGALIFRFTGKSKA